LFVTVMVCGNVPIHTPAEMFADHTGAALAGQALIGTASVAVFSVTLQ
jgi:hypothetical protein